MLQLEQALATFSNLNCRIEKVGRDKHRPAADLQFKVDIPNTQLDQIHPGLLNSLYKHPNEQGHQADLTAPDPNSLTTPRYPKAKAWASTEDWPGYFLTLSHGEFAPVNVDLDKVTLKSITVDAKNGGTASLSFTLSGYPSGEDVGALYDLMGSEVDLTINPPALGDLDRLRKEAKAKADTGNGAADGGDNGDDDGDDAAPTGDQAAGRAFPDAIDARGDKPPSTRRGRKPAGATAH